MFAGGGNRRPKRAARSMPGGEELDATIKFL